MMKIYQNPEKSLWSQLVERPKMDTETLWSLVKEVFQEVKTYGDKAVINFTEKFDKVLLNNLQVSQEEILESYSLVNADLKNAILQAASNIKDFHRSQKEKKKVIETTSGVYCWRESRPIEKVGIYIPGGTAPLFSTVLMLAIPAQITGCQEIILCTPPNSEGKVHPAILFSAAITGVTKIFKIGGIQSIAAMALGTETVPKVYKIFGPGNQYVTTAKEYAQTLGIAIDMPAGPSEVLIIADEWANPEFVAADLLSQAEHGADSQVVLLSHSRNLLEATQFALNQQLEDLPRKNVAIKALENSYCIEFPDLQTCFEFSNFYAPEHLILAIKKAKKYTDFIQNAGSVFLGKYSCESAGDYASGTNHTLPTAGFAKAFSGVSLDSFMKKITFQKITKKGMLNLGNTIEIMAENEELFAHKNAVSIRLNDLKNDGYSKLYKR